MEKSATLEFINHASVLISCGEIGVLTDPWYSGSVFHDGWSLLAETADEYVHQLLGRTSHIWISHEHPDHFSPPFFLKFKNLINAHKIKILFQKTEDQRVVDFLRVNEFEVQELQNTQWYQLSDVFELCVFRSDLYDSALLMNVQGVKIFNLNDCPIHSEKHLIEFSNKFGNCDLLLTQFSYASWKGGKNKRAWRRKAAKAKLTTMRRQIEHLAPKTAIPFASFAYFSNDLNFYMNDEINTPADVNKFLSKTAANLVFMKPTEIQNLNQITQDSRSLDWWQSIYSNLDALPKNQYETKIEIDQLVEAFGVFQCKIFKKNSRSLMAIARAVLPMRPFGKTRIQLMDLDRIVEVDLLGSFKEVDANADIVMHSASLYFIFKHEFGFDTLFVNGCFEVLDSDGFSRFAKCFIIGNLNAMGLTINLIFLKRLDVIQLLIRRLLSVQKNLN